MDFDCLDEYRFKKTSSKKDEWVAFCFIKAPLLMAINLGIV